MPSHLSIIIPLRNESGSVAPLARRIFAALADAAGTFELILIDDGSTDDTWQQAVEAGQGRPHARAFRHSRPEGQSAALWTGFRASQGEILATLDGDLQNDPADLPRLLALLESPPVLPGGAARQVWDLVCGVRTRRADNVLRRLSSRAGRLAMRAALGSRLAALGRRPSPTAARVDPQAAAVAVDNPHEFGRIGPRKRE